MAAIDFESVVIGRGSKHVETELNGEVALMHVETGEFFAMRETSAAIWRLLEEPKSSEEIIAGLISIYNVDRDQCQSELEPWLQEMADFGLVTCS